MLGRCFVVLSLHLNTPLSRDLCAIFQFSMNVYLKAAIFSIFVSRSLVFLVLILLFRSILVRKHFTAETVSQLPVVSPNYGQF